MYSLQVERQLPQGIALKLGYIGGMDAISQPVSHQPVAGQSIFTEPARSARRCLCYSGLGQWPVKTQSRSRRLLPFSAISGITMATSLGRSDYNALDVKVAKALQQGCDDPGSIYLVIHWDNIWGAVRPSNTLNSATMDRGHLQPVHQNMHAQPTTFKPLYCRWIMELPVGRGKACLDMRTVWSTKLLVAGDSTTS